MISMQRLRLKTVIILKQAKCESDSCMKVQLRTTSLLQVYIKVCLKKVIENQLTEYLITKIDDNLSVGFVTICLWAVIIGPVFFSHS